MKLCVAMTVIWVSLLAVLITPAPVRAGDDWEWWLDLPVWAPLGRGLSLEATGSLKFKNDMSLLYNRGVSAGPYYRATSWLCLGFDYWYREVRKTAQTAWVDHDTLVGRANLNWKTTDWLQLQLHNRLEYDTDFYLWRVRVRPRALLPFSLWALPAEGVIDNEFFFCLDYPRGRETYSENRFTVGVQLDPSPLFRLQLAYRRVDTRPGDEWSGANVLSTCVKIRL